MKYNLQVRFSAWLLLLCIVLCMISVGRFFYLAGKDGLKLTHVHIHRFETPIKILPQELHGYIYIDYPEALKEQKEINADLQRRLERIEPHVNEIIRTVEDLNKNSD